jgi:hypothetical protein
MKPFAFLIAVLSSIFAAVCGTAQASPITAAGIAGNASAANLIPVYYHHHRYHHYWHHGGAPLASYWDYYRVDRPGRGTSVESTR